MKTQSWYVLISDCLWFRYWGNTNMTTARRTSSPTGGWLHIILSHTQLEFWTWTSQPEKDPGALPAPGTPWSPTIMWCRWRDGWTWRLLYTCLRGSIRIKPTSQFDQSDIVSYCHIVSYCYILLLLGWALVVLSVSSSLRCQNPPQSHSSDEQQGGWSHVAREVVDWSRERQSFAQDKRSAESSKESMNIHWGWDHRWSLPQWSLKNMGGHL